MNNLSMFYMWFMMAASGIFAYKSVIAIVAYFETRRRKKDYSALEKVTRNNVCKDFHNWESIRLALSGLPIDLYKVCTECGAVANDIANVKLNAPALEVFKNELRIRKERNEFLSELNTKKQQELDKIMDKMVKWLLNNDGYYKHHDLNAKVEVIRQFFRKSVIEIDSMYDELNKEIEQVENRG